MTTLLAPLAPALDTSRLRADFPILGERVHGHPLAYLDNAASAQKPRQVIETMRQVMESGYANVHRGVHTLSQMATLAYEGAREKVARFLNAASEQEIIFTSGATDSLNLVALSWGAKNLQAGDEVILSVLEHHSNIVPWQLLRERLGIVLRVIPVDDRGVLDQDVYATLLQSPRARLVAVTHISNAIGTITPIAAMIRMAHERGVPVLVDGCQSAPHRHVDVRALDADFYAFSGHKVYGPTGIGVLYGKKALLKDMPPVKGGGDMITSVSFERTIFREPPYRFEAGTPAIVEAIGLGAAVDYVRAVGQDAIAAHEEHLRALAEERLAAVPGLRIIGTAPEKAGIVSFVMDGIHPHDIGSLVDGEGVAIRVGHHCAEPLMRRFSVPATARASFALYNTPSEVEALAAALVKVRDLFG